MEERPAQDASGVTVSMDMVDQADIYIGIYAWRYGWVPDGKGISITEMEFDRALAQKDAGKLREILIFIAHDDHLFTRSEIEADGDAQKKLEQFKNRAGTGRQRKLFSSAEELRRLLVEALYEFRIRNNAPA